MVTIITATILMSASPLSAQWTNDAVTVNINANMPEITQLKFTESGTIIPLATETPTWTNIGTMHARSNQTDGYIIAVSSTNSGVLQGPLGETVAYSLRYGGSEYSSLTGSVTVATATDRTSFAGVASEVEISPLVNLDADFLYAGTYTDTLTFTISAQ